MAQSILVSKISENYKGDFSPIHFDDLLNDSNSPFSNNAILCLYENDNIDIPHFHLMDIKLDSPICIYKSKYIFHNNSNDMLNNIQLKYLWKILNMNFGCLHNTFWEELCLEWDSYHDTNFYNDNSQIPNYIGGIII